MTGTARFNQLTDLNDRKTERARLNQPDDLNDRYGLPGTGCSEKSCRPAMAGLACLETA